MKNVALSLVTLFVTAALLWPVSAEASWRDCRQTGSKSYSRNYDYNQNRGYKQRRTGYKSTYQQPRTSGYSYRRHDDCCNDYHDSCGSHGRKTYYQQPQRTTYQRSYNYDYDYQRDYDYSYDYGSRYSYDYDYGYDSWGRGDYNYQSPQYSNILNLGNWGWGW